MVTLAILLRQEKTVHPISKYLHLTLFYVLRVTNIDPLHIIFPIVKKKF